MKFETYEYTIPTWALCPLLYGDITGISEEDNQALTDFEKTLPGSGHWDFNDEEYFSHDNDIDGLGNTVVDAKYLVLVQE